MSSGGGGGGGGAAGGGSGIDLFLSVRGGPAPQRDARGVPGLKCAQVNLSSTVYMNMNIYQYIQYI